MAKLAGFRKPSTGRMEARKAVDRIPPPPLARLYSLIRTLNLMLYTAAALWPSFIAFFLLWEVLAGVFDGADMNQPFPCFMGRQDTNARKAADHTEVQEEGLLTSRCNLSSAKALVSNLDKRDLRSQKIDKLTSSRSSLGLLRRSKSRVEQHLRVQPRNRPIWGHCRTRFLRYLNLRDCPGSRLAR